MERIQSIIIHMCIIIIMYVLSIFLVVESGSDFSPAPSLNIIFTAGTISSPATECASIEIMEDVAIECDHSFTVEAEDIECDVEPAIVSASPSKTVTIEDNDGIATEHNYNYRVV